MKNIATLCALCVFGFAQAQGQPEKNVGNVEISVVEQYKASIKEAAKITGQPDFSDTTSAKLPVKYSVTPHKLTFTYKPELIQPMRVSGVKLGKLPTSMVRLGGGNYTTSLAEILVSNARSKSFSWDVGLRHFGTRAGVKDIAFKNAPFYENTLYADGRWLFKDYRLKAKAGIDWNVSSFYGLPATAADSGYAVGDLQKNSNQRYYASMSFDRVFRKRQSAFENATLNYHYYTNNWQTHENLITLQTKWQLPKEIENHRVQTQLNMLWQKSVLGEVLPDNNQLNVQFFPTIKGKYEVFDYTLGINFNFYNVNTPIPDTESANDFLMYIFPELRVNAILVRDVLDVFGGWTGNVTTNSMYSLTLQNPFVLPAVSLAPSADNHIFAGMEGALARNISYKLQGNIHYVKNKVLYYRSGDTLVVPFQGMDLPAFNVIYTGGSYSSARGEVTYKAKKTEVSGFTELFNYQLKGDKDDVQVPYHLPKMIVGAQVRQTIKEKIEVNASLAYVGGRNALNQDAHFYDAKMKNIWDAKLGLGYNINNNLSAALDLTNLASQDYSLWLGYPSQRIRVMLSLMYKF